MKNMIKIPMVDTVNLSPTRCKKIRNWCKTLTLNDFWKPLVGLFGVTVAIYFAFMFKEYIQIILLWLENQNRLLIAVTIICLFLIVSLPISVGYIILVIASGYIFGQYYGVLIVMLGANLGLFMAHRMLKSMGHLKIIYRYTQTQTAQAIRTVIQGPLCFKIVLCSRLTPIPFGLQNTIFAFSNVDTTIYHIASLIGLFPAQFVGVYFGTTLRSMQDVVSKKMTISPITYFVISIQLVLCASLFILIGFKAKKELSKALSNGEDTKNILQNV